MKDYNEGRAIRAANRAQFKLCTFTFTRRAEIPLDVITDFSEAMASVDGSGVDSVAVVRTFLSTFMECVDPKAIVTETGEAIDTKKAWKQMTTIGDEYGPIGAQTLGEVVMDLIAKGTDLPTSEPSVSPDGSPTEPATPSSTPLSPSEEATSVA